MLGFKVFVKLMIMLRLWHHFQSHRFSHKQLYMFCVVILLYTIGDGIISFFLPIAVERHLKYMVLVGFVLASSSFWDIVADIFFGISNKPLSYRILTKIAFILMLGLILLNLLPTGERFGLSLGVLLLSMVFWGFYYESFIIGTYDFVVVTTEKREQATSYGVIEVFRSLGYTIGPIIGGWAILKSMEAALVSAAFFALIGLVYLVTQLKKESKLPLEKQSRRRISLRDELNLWGKIGRKIYPLLLMTFSLGFCNGVIFSITPIMVEEKINFTNLGGFIVACFTLPMVLLSGLFGSLASRYNKHLFVISGSLLVTLSFIFFGVLETPWLAMAAAFLVGTGISLFTPALDAQYGGYISDHTRQEKETLGEMGVAVNLGFIVGTSLAGVAVAASNGYWLPYFLVSLVFALTSLVYYFFAFQKKMNLVEVQKA